MLQPRGMEPSYKVDRVRWNQAWEEHLNKSFSPASIKRGDVLKDVPLQMHASLTGEWVLMSLENTRREISRLQRDLCIVACEKCAEDDFEDKWVATSPKDREGFLLEGLCRTCAAVPDMELQRQHCPETCLPFLQQDDGRGFLKTLRGLLPPVHRPWNEVIFLPHPAFDAIHGASNIYKPGEPPPVVDGRRVMHRIRILHRCTFLTLFVWNSLLAFYGLSERYRLVKVGPSDKTIVLDPEARKFARSSLGKKATRQLEQDLKEERKLAQWQCMTCLKPESDLPAGKKLSACVKCLNMGRTIKYCNKACQLQDWRSGDPPHKTFCGRPLTLAETLSPALPPCSQETIDNFPPPDPGFVHTPSLRHQILLLRENPTVDYILVRPPGEPDEAFTFPDPAEKAAFRALRYQAMKNGDPKSVGTICNQLENTETPHPQGFTRQQLMRQLMKEYKVSEDTFFPPPPPPPIELKAQPAPEGEGDVAELTTQLEETKVV